MIGSRFSLLRFLALAAFIVAAAVFVWLAELAWPLIIVAMAAATLIAWAIEWLAWREGQSRARVGERAAADRRPAASEPAAEPSGTVTRLPSLGVGGGEPESAERPPAAERDARRDEEEERVEPLEERREEPVGAQSEGSPARPGQGGVEAVTPPALVEERAQASREREPDGPASPPLPRILPGAPPPRETEAEPEERAPVEAQAPGASAEVPERPAEAGEDREVAEVAAASEREDSATVSGAPEGPSRPEAPAAPVEAGEARAPEAPPVRPVTPVRPAPFPAGHGGPVVTLPPRRREPREWNLWELETLAREEARRQPARSLEWSYVLLHLRDYADPGGTLPVEFDGVVRETFGSVLERVERT